MVDLIKMDVNNIPKDGRKVNGVEYTPLEILIQHLICAELDIHPDEVLNGNLKNLYGIESDIPASYHVKDYIGKYGYDKDIVEQILLWYSFDKLISKETNEQEKIKYSDNSANFIVKFETYVGGLVNQITGSITMSVQSDFANLPIFIEKRKEILALATEDAVLHSGLIEQKISQLESIALKWLDERPTHPLSVAIKAGVYNNLQTIKAFVIVGKQSLEGNIQPFPVVNGYFNGFTHPIEMVNEISSAKTANKYSLLFVAFTEKFSKEFQFNVPTKPSISEDCDTAQGCVQVVTPQTMGNAVWVDGAWVETHRYNIHNYIGKKLKVRLPHTCGDIAKGMICKKCIGTITKHHPEATNVLFTLGSALNEGVSQTVLKTKHFIASAESTNKGRNLLDTYFKPKGVELEVTVDTIEIYVTSKEVSAILFDEQGPSFDDFESIMIDDTSLSSINKLLIVQTVGNERTINEYTLTEPISLNKHYLIRYLADNNIVGYNDVEDDEIEEHIERVFGEDCIPVRLTIKRGDMLFKYKEKTEDIKKVSDEIIGLFSIPNELKKLKMLGIEDWVERKHGVAVLKKKHYNDFYQRIVDTFRKVGGLSNTSLSACMAMLMLDSHGEHMKGFKSVLKTGYMSSMVRSESSDPYKSTNFLPVNRTSEPMDVILTM